MDKRIPNVKRIITIVYANHNKLNLQLIILQV